MRPESNTLTGVRQIAEAAGSVEGRESLALSRRPAIIALLHTPLSQDTTKDAVDDGGRSAHRVHLFDDLGRVVG